MTELGFSEDQARGDAFAPKIHGGETQALRNVEAFFQQLRKGPAAVGPAGALMAAYEEKVAPFVSTGCLSPRRLYRLVAAQLGGASAQPQPQPQASSPAGFVQTELYYRDFFLFQALKFAPAAAKAQPQLQPALSG